MIILDFFDDETTGNTDCKNSSSKDGFKNANSSIIRILIDPPRPELPDVASAVILQSLSNTIEALFHSFIPWL